MREFLAGQIVKALGSVDGGIDEAVNHVRNFHGPQSSVFLYLEKSSTGTSDLGADADFKYSPLYPSVQQIKRYSLPGKINAISPFRQAFQDVPVLRQNSRPVTAYVAESGLIPVEKSTFDQLKIPGKKIAGLMVFPKELLMAVGETFEQSVTSDIVNPMAYLESQIFIDPDNAGITDKVPASVTYDTAPLSSTGSARGDIQRLVDNFQGDIEKAVLVMHPATGVKAGAYFNDTVGARGGDCAGIPTVTSNALPFDSNGSLISLIDPSGILMMDDGISITKSTAASIEFTTGEFYSLFQNDLVGIIITRNLTWEVARAGSVLSIAPTWVDDPL